MPYYSLLHQSLYPFLLTSPDGAILVANPAACELFGWSEDDLRRIGRAGVIDETDPALAAALDVRAKTGRFVGVLTLVRRGGSRFRAEISSRVFTDESGAKRTSMVIRDLSAPAAATTQSANETEPLQFAVQASPLATIGIDLAGHVVLWNPAAETLFGWRADEVIGRMNPLVGPAQAPDYDALRARALRGETVTGAMVQRLRKDGTPIDVALSTALTRDSDGRPSGFVAILAERTTAQADVEAAVAAARRAALRQLALGLRHEMNNALTGLSVEAQLLIAGPLEEQVRAAAAAILDQARRIAAILVRLERVEDLGLVQYIAGEMMVDVSGEHPSPLR